MIRLDTALGFAILGLLHLEPRSGYDLRKIFTTTPFDHFSDSPGAIYPALLRLRRKGWIRGTRPAGGRRRREFRLTPSGRRAWRAWLGRLPTRADVVWGMDHLMLRFAFMGDALPRSASLRFLEALTRRIDAHVADLRQYRKQTGISLPGRLAFDAGLEMYEARAQWVRRARAWLRRKGARS